MTTITIKNGEKLSRTNFENIEDFLNWAVDYFVEDKPLSVDIINKCEKAKIEKKSSNSSFIEVL
jgi:hypothetical protein